MEHEYHKTRKGGKSVTDVYNSSVFQIVSINCREFANEWNRYCALVHPGLMNPIANRSVQLFGTGKGGYADYILNEMRIRDMFNEDTNVAWRSVSKAARFESAFQYFGKPANSVIWIPMFTLTDLSLVEFFLSDMSDALETFQTLACTYPVLLATASVIEDICDCYFERRFKTINTDIQNYQNNINNGDNKEKLYNARLRHKKCIERMQQAGRARRAFRHKYQKEQKATASSPIGDNVLMLMRSRL